MMCMVDGYRTLPRPSLELLLSIKRSADVVGVLAIDQPRDPILARETRDEAVLVLIDAPSKVARDANVKGP